MCYFLTVKTSSVIHTSLSERHFHVFLSLSYLFLGLCDYRLWVFHERLKKLKGSVVPQQRTVNDPFDPISYLFKTLSFTRLCSEPHCHYLIAEIFITPRKNLLPMSSHFPYLPSSPPVVFINLFFISEFLYSRLLT